METDLLFLIGIGLALIGGMIVYRFVFWTVERGFTDRARAVDDPEFRAQKIAELTAALAAQPARAELWQQRAQLYAYDQNFPAAIADAEKYCALKPRDLAGQEELAEYKSMSR